MAYATRKPNDNPLLYRAKTTRRPGAYFTPTPNPALPARCSRIAARAGRIRQPGASCRGSETSPPVATLTRRRPPASRCAPTPPGAVWGQGRARSSGGAAAPRPPSLSPQPPPRPSSLSPQTAPRRPAAPLAGLLLCSPTSQTHPGSAGREPSRGQSLGRNDGGMTSRSGPCHRRRRSPVRLARRNAAFCVNGQDFSVFLFFFFKNRFICF